MTSEDIVKNLRAIYDYEHSIDPGKTPISEFRKLHGQPIRTIVTLLSDAGLKDDEYVRLLHFAVENLFGTKLIRNLERNKEEFVYQRQKCGVTQQWIADKVGISVTTVRRWENPDSEYTPSREAWQVLDELDKWEYDTAKSVLEKHLKEQDKFLSDEFMEYFDPEDDTPDDEPIIIRLRYCLTEEQYRKLVSLSRPLDFDGEGLDMVSEDDECRFSIRHSQLQAEEGVWCILDNPDMRLDMQNALVSRMYGIVQRHEFSSDATSREVITTFSQNAEVTQVRATVKRTKPLEDIL